VSGSVGASCVTELFGDVEMTGSVEFSGVDFIKI
jgi:hypothetical protein